MWRSALVLVLAATPALAELLPSPVPPIDPSLAPRAEEEWAVNRVVEGAQTELALEQVSIPTQVEGTVASVDVGAGVLRIDGEEPGVLLQPEPDTTIVLDGEPLDDLSQVPEGAEVRATFEPGDDGSVLELCTIGVSGECE